MNQPDKLIDLIVGRTKTTVDKDKLSAEIAVVKAAIFKKPEVLESVLRHDLRAWVADVVREGLSATKNPDKWLDDIVRALENHHIIELTVAFEPTEVIIEHFAGWIDRELKDKFLLEVKTDRRLIAGTTISYQGKYHDYSLRKIFQKFQPSLQPMILKIVSQAISTNPAPPSTPASLP
ncbi:hypothetical protein A2783_04210 [Microgenomates group bacterium RIFCSPHIGHO2_01_FULL_45_11]|nr:MAG: hypothetical protein A2783_04210 [Microgenomates group bacterium RIFCSPHIGHO2_01_FULL_45_11]